MKTYNRFKKAFWIITVALTITTNIQHLLHKQLSLAEIKSPPIQAGLLFYTKIGGKINGVNHKTG